MKKTPREKLDPIFFNVKKVEASKNSPNLKFASSLSHQIIVTTPAGEKMVVNQCSESYTLVKNAEIFVPLLEEMEKKHEVDVHVVTYDYSKFYVDFILKDLAFGKDKQIQVGEMSPRMRVNNSYDGSIKYSYHFGFYRYVCKNGAAVPVPGKMRNAKFLHTPYVANDRAIKETLKDLTSFLDSAKDLYKGYNILRDKTMSLKQAEERIEEVVKEISDYPKTAQEIAVNRLGVEAGMRYPINDFLVYNALNFALYQNPESEMRTHKRDKVDFQVLDYLIAENS